MAKTIKKAEGPRHYFGSTVFNWATGQTAEEVLKALAINCGTSILKGNVEKHGGLQATLCIVEMPESTHYDIRNYMPVGVPTHSYMQLRIQNTKGHCLPYERDEHGYKWDASWRDEALAWLDAHAGADKDTEAFKGLRAAVARKF